MCKPQEEYPEQEQELVYALDIGTRSVIGMLGKLEEGRVHILAIEKQPHKRRAMLDGQIEDIDQAAETVKDLTRRLEKSAERRLTRACVAAAGRSLRTERGSGRRGRAAPGANGPEQSDKRTAPAGAAAEQSLQEEGEKGQRMFLVGYTVTQYRLDSYPMAKLKGHTGRLLEADVVATFLPSEVVNSLNAVVRRAGLETASLTLEPIAALNAAIPPQLRLLNLVLVDIGAGTCDVAACRDGSVVGYTMGTMAGDEVSEALMRQYLIDFDTAERVKAELSVKQTIQFEDVVGLEQTLPAQEILQSLEPTVQALAGEISRRVQELNGGPPSALFLAGGGSKLAGLCGAVADALGMDRKRVALAGSHFKTNSFAEGFSLEDPEYATPLGIAVSACLGLVSDSSRVYLNGAPAKLFRSGQLTVMELLMMNGYSYGDLIGRSGSSLSLYVDGRRVVYHGEPAVPAQLTVNGAPAQAATVLYAGDRIVFSPAKDGAGRVMTAGQLARELSAEGFTSHGVPLDPESRLQSGDRLSTLSRQEREENPAVPPSVVSPGGAVLRLRLNGQERSLPPKRDGSPYYLMDLLEYSGLDFDRLERPVLLKVNGREGLFQQVISSGDEVEIHYEDPEKE